MVFPRGAAAYAAALRNEITDRKTAGSSLLLLGPITASTVARQELQGGQVDSRLLLTLAELAFSGRSPSWRSVTVPRVPVPASRSVPLTW